MGIEPRESLTVLVVTRNHQTHIARALESVYSQEGVEIDRVIVSDDASTDGTLAAIRDCLSKLGMTAEVVESAEQMGVTRHYQKLFSDIDTDLVAILEGDDYWFDRTKLQRQVSLLHKYPYTSACAFSYVIFRQETASFDSRSFDGALSIRGTEELVMCDGFGFSNMLYRADVLRRIPSDFYSLTTYDWIINALVSRQAPIIYVDLPGIAYRFSSAGAWSGLEPSAQTAVFVDAIKSYIPHADDYLAALLRERLSRIEAERPAVLQPEPIGMWRMATRKARSALTRLTDG